ncbi:MAG: ImmA/IrrE family metallo-endopeptidase [Thermomicrobiales bacterium]
MIPGWLAEAADLFWDAAGDPPPFPRDLTYVLPYALPVYQQIMPGLRLASIDNWLSRHGCAQRFDAEDRELCGCLVAYRGFGMIFVDGADEPNERRFTLAHEVAHFLLDYYMPRAKAQALLGPEILPVLDGDRAPTQDERIDAAIAKCAIGVHVHLLDRRDPSGEIAGKEDRADRLARELLAPDEVLSDRYREYAFDEFAMAQDLEAGFGLPPAEAAAYARARLHGRRATILQWRQR